MVLSGIVFGIFMAAAADMAKVFALYKDWHFYLYKSGKFGFPLL